MQIVRVIVKSSVNNFSDFEINHLLHPIPISRDFPKVWWPIVGRWTTKFFDYFILIMKIFNDNCKYIICMYFFDATYYKTSTIYLKWYVIKPMYGLTQIRSSSTCSGINCSRFVSTFA
jgi:hypothetical protein